MEDDNKKIQNLIGSFAKDARKHHRSIMNGDAKTAKDQSKKIHQIFLKLCEIGIEGRNALLSLVDDEDDSVAIMAATYSLKYNTEKSIDALRRVGAKPGILALSAKQAIMRWEEGTWKLE